MKTWNNELKKKAYRLYFCMWKDLIWFHLDKLCESYDKSCFICSICLFANNLGKLLRLECIGYAYELNFNNLKKKLQMV